MLRRSRRKHLTVDALTILKYPETAHTCCSVEVLGKLQTLAEKFVKKTCAAKGLSEHVVNNSGGKIFTFGSYRLGAYGPGG